MQCRFCWSSEQEDENPLLSSCKCDGSVRFIHYECLKNWIRVKMQKKEETSIVSYVWKQFECEICKKAYPYTFKSNGKKFKLVDVPIPEEGNFLLLQSLTFEKNSSRMVHLLMPKEAKVEFVIGRGHDSDMRVSDISVSRCHAMIKYNRELKQFQLEDNLSKFGTLVLANDPFNLHLNHTTAIQIGRSVISFTVKPSSPHTAPPARFQLLQESPQKDGKKASDQTIESLVK